MDERAHGLILRTRPLTETSLIVQWLTPEFGRIATVAKGARRAKSPYRGKLDLYYLAEFTFQRSRRSDLHNLREVSLRDSRTPLRTDLDYLQQAAYCAALLEMATETEAPIPELFELLNSFLDQLPAQPPLSHLVFAYEIKVLDELGLRPDLKEAALTPGTRTILTRLLEADWPTLARLKLAPAQFTQIDAFLNGFIFHHLDRIPKGRQNALLKPFNPH